MDRLFTDNFIEKGKYKKLELKKWKYLEISSPCIARFRAKQYDDKEKSSNEWNVVAVKNLSAGGIIFNYYKMSLEFGSLLELKIDFIKSKPAISCVGRVVRFEDTHANSMFRIETEFAGINGMDREIINTTIESIIKREAKKRVYSEKLKKIRNIINALAEIAHLRTVLRWGVGVGISFVAYITATYVNNFIVFLKENLCIIY